MIIKIPEYNGPGIYMIKNMITNKTYIGKAMKLKYRINSHITALEKGTHVLHEMQIDYNNGDDFEISVIETLPN